MLKKSIRATFIRVFIFASFLPIVLLGVYSFYNISKTIRVNTQTLIENNLEQVDATLHVRLDAYQDLLYQIYTDDEMIEWVNNIDADVDYALTLNQIRRNFNSLLNSKSYMRAITVITPNGKIVTYDQMSATSGESAWLENFSETTEELYAEVTADAHAHIYDTEYATTFANKDYYTFHMAHRIINYRDISKQCGIVILTLDEELLEDICNHEESEEFTYITGKNGNPICYMGEDLSSYEQSEIFTYRDEGLGWNICYYHDASELTKSVQNQLGIIIGVALVALLVAFFVSSLIERDLSKSIKVLFHGMKRVENGNLSARIDTVGMSPEEITGIAEGFNRMIEKLESALQKERIATANEKEAQIAALEAQINPHFLYNTLDTINWMAIDKDEYDISNAINSLAFILRYAIVNSNEEVTIKEELEWLKKYIHLQQFRVKNSFSCQIDADSEVQQCKVHKLLMQPYIENSIVHGFEGKQEKAVLKVRINLEDAFVIIEIEDNGSGMPQELVEYINEGCMDMTGDRTHIGMANVATRLKMYYGGQAKVVASSEIGVGTKITIRIPISA